MSRFVLIKGPDEMIEAFLETMKGCGTDDSHFECVEIVPEQRDSNWMEIALAGKFEKRMPRR